MEEIEEMEEFNLLIAGVGGQGNILAAHLLAEAAVMEGFKVRVGETFGMSQRGGSVVSHVRMGSRIYSPIVPLKRGNLIVGLEPIETLRVAVKYASSESYIFFNTTPIPPVSVNIGKCTYPKVDDVIYTLNRLGKKVVGLDASSLTKRTGESRTLNMVMIGFCAGSKIMPIRLETFKKTMKGMLPHKWLHLNLKAFELGVKASAKIKATTPI